MEVEGRADPDEQRRRKARAHGRASSAPAWAGPCPPRPRRPRRRRSRATTRLLLLGVRGRKGGESPPAIRRPGKRSRRRASQQPQRLRRAPAVEVDGHAAAAAARAQKAAHQVRSVDAGRAAVAERVQRPHQGLAVGHRQGRRREGLARLGILAGAHDEVDRRRGDVAAAPARDRRLHPVDHLLVVADGERHAQHLGPVGQRRARGRGRGRLPVARLREDTRRRGDRSRLLVPAAGADHRPYGLQGSLAVAVAAVARRRADRSGSAELRPAPRSTRAPGSARACASCAVDVARRGRLCSSAVRAAAPEVVLHLAAQPMVRRSLREPALTYEVNLMGTVNVLEAVRAGRRVRSGHRWSSPPTSATRTLRGTHRPVRRGGPARRRATPTRARRPAPSSRRPPTGARSPRSGALAEPGHGPGRQRDRRRRLGRGPPAAGRPARARGRGAAARSQPGRRPSLAARPRPAVGLPAARPGAVATTGRRRGPGTSAPPAGRRATVGWIVGRLAELWEGGLAWSTDEAAEPARGGPSGARLGRGRGASSGWRAALGLEEALALDRRMAPGRERSGEDMRGREPGADRAGRDRANRLRAGRRHRASRSSVGLQQPALVPLRTGGAAAGRERWHPPRHEPRWPSAATAPSGSCESEFEALRRRGASRRVAGAAARFRRALDASDLDACYADGLAGPLRGDAARARRSPTRRRGWCSSPIAGRSRSCAARRARRGAAAEADGRRVEPDLDGRARRPRPGCAS